MEMLKKLVTWLIVLAILGAAGYGGYRYWLWRQAEIAKRQAAAKGRGDGAIPLPVGECVIRDVMDTLDFTGTTDAYNVVEVRARVEGYLQSIHFDDGAYVEKDQLLFTIEPDMYRARRDEAAASLKAAQTELKRAREDLERIEKAVRSGSVSQQDLTRAQAAFDTAQAQVMGAQAALDTAELNLSYTEIRSPIAGRIGRRLADVGNLVGATDRTVLTTVRQIEPIYTYFYVSEYVLKDNLLRRFQGDQGAEPMKLNVGLPHHEDYPYAGIIDFLDNTVDHRTGTVYVRGVLPNKEHTLLPGMFVRVSLPIQERKNAVLVPEMAVLSDLGGKYLLVVDQGNTLRRRDIQLGASYGELRLVTEGLDGSETFLIGGFHIARAGMPIQPVREGQTPPGGMPNTSSESTTDKVAPAPSGNRG